MRIDGACHCGFITYEAEIDPAKVIICHCTDCQMLTGTAFRTVAMTREGTFRLLSGKLKYYVKTAESGTKRQQSFCPECGTPIFSTTESDGPKVHAIRIGSIRQRALLVPGVQFWCRSAQRWLSDLASIPKIETQPGFTERGGVA
ncbi:MAG: GFA family protein [Dongiaceae bacterium]